jgi:hypothetical protein
MSTPASRPVAALTAAATGLTGSFENTPPGAAAPAAASPAPVAPALHDETAATLDEALDRPAAVRADGDRRIAHALETLKGLPASVAPIRVRWHVFFLGVSGAGVFCRRPKQEWSHSPTGHLGVPAPRLFHGCQTLLDIIHLPLQESGLILQGTALSLGIRGATVRLRISGRRPRAPTASVPSKASPPETAAEAAAPAPSPSTVTGGETGSRVSGAVSQSASRAGSLAQRACSVSTRHGKPPFCGLNHWFQWRPWPCRRWRRRHPGIR